MTTEKHFKRVTAFISVFGGERTPHRLPFMNLSNYPSGVTGNEPQINGDAFWENLLDAISRDAASNHMTDMDVWVAWRLGLAAFKEGEILRSQILSRLNHEQRP